MLTVTTERSVYQEAYKSSQQVVKNNFSLPAPGSMVLPVSNDIKGHYSFDIAQQVNLKSIMFWYLLLIIGALSQWPISAWSCVFLDPKKMCSVWGML